MKSKIMYCVTTDQVTGLLKEIVRGTGALRPMSNTDRSPSITCSQRGRMFMSRRVFSRLAALRGVTTTLGSGAGDASSRTPPSWMQRN